jgi:calcium-dependent protein kinase
MGNQASSVTSLDSDSSWKSDPTASESASSVKIASLHGNLMRTQYRRDPMEIFDVLEILGEGSMGSVSRVRKRESAVGGSARSSYVLSRHSECCPFAKWCLPGLKPGFQALSSHDNSSIWIGFSNHPALGNPTKVSINSDENNIIAPFSPNTRRLGRQGSSMVTYGSNKEVNYALKSIHLDRCSNSTYKDELKNEVEILKNLDHPNIVRCIETFDYRDRMFIALELCNGGDLYTRDPYTEKQAQEIVQSLFGAIAYIHSRGIVHRDLKFENVMFVSIRSSEVKLIDFGLSQKFAANEHLHDAVGTVYTMAPELLAGDYDAKADVWSLGVIAFMLLSSAMPFYGKTRDRVIRKIVRGKYDFKSRRWKQVSEDAKMFVTGLLQVDIATRPTASDVLQDQNSWLQRNFDVNGHAPEVDMMDSVQAAIEAFADYGKLKKLALMVIAYKSTEEEIGFLRKVFKKFDVSQNGEISLSEFSAALRRHYDYTDSEIFAMFRGIDVDGTGSVHYIEFLGATLLAHGSMHESRIAEAYDRIDCDDTGYITVANLREFLGNDVPTRYLEEIIEEADITHDHRISYDEFLALWDDEGDAALQSSKISVQSRRVMRENSLITSSISSVDSRFTDSIRSDELLETDSGGATGSQYFGERKEQSVRGGSWV